MEYSDKFACVFPICTVGSSLREVSPAGTWKTDTINPLTPVKPETMDLAAFELLIEEAKRESIRIYQEYIAENAPHEINIVSIMKKSLFLANSSGIISPDIYAAAFEHVLHMLENEWFRKFLSCQRHKKIAVTKLNESLEFPTAIVEQDVPEPPMCIEQAGQNPKKSKFARLFGWKR